KYVKTVITYLLLTHSSAIKCYVCNSHNDTACNLDLLPETTKTDCSEKVEGAKYTMCRKIVQNIDFEVNGNKPETRVIRSCGWDDSNYKGRCYQRSGFGGRQEVCSCLTDLCNAPVSEAITSIRIVNCLIIKLLNI
ncbi:hypothetical protein L9F63_023561, partial [Diploptera punctata]